MLHSTSKTVIEIQMVGRGGLTDFVRECYGLEDRWFCNELINGASYLFNINPNDGDGDDTEYFAGYDLNDALEIINSEGDYYGDIGSVLARLCYDKFIPPGNYLVDVSW